MTTLILFVPLFALLYLFVIGAKASIENERGQIDWLLQMGIPKAVIVVLFFVFAPWVVWNGCMWCVWRVKMWWALRRVKRLAMRGIKEVMNNHKGNAELVADLKDLKDKLNKL